MVTMTTNETTTTILTNKLSKKAQDLGIEFQIETLIRSGSKEIAVKMKRNFPDIWSTLEIEDIAETKQRSQNQKEFAEFVADLIISEYANSVRFEYPESL